MIYVLLEAATTQLHAEIASRLREASDIELIDAPPGSASAEESHVRPDVVIIAPKRDETAFDSYGWSATGVPIILLLDNPAREISEPSFAEAMPSSIRAVLPRRVSSAELKAAVEAVAAGLMVFHPEDREWLPGSRSQNAAPASEEEPLVESLTPREIEVLQLLASGLGNREIAVRLNLSEHTAKFHVASIMGKLGASSRTEAVTIGIRRGLVMI